MKNVAVPSVQQLAVTYEILLHDFQNFADRSNCEIELVLWMQWARLDARLGEILVAAIARHFYLLNPLRIWQALQRSPEPATAGVILEFVGQSIDAKKSPARQKMFVAWKQAVISEVKKASPQLFFVDDGAPNAKRAYGQITHSLTEYSNWGFWASDSLLSSKAVQRKSLSRSQRSQILLDLIEAKSLLTVNDYLAACEFKIPRRTAERDLIACPKLRARGFTRARFYERINRPEVLSQRGRPLKAQL